MNKILDFFGRSASRGLVDASGNEVSSEPSTRHGEQAGAGNGAADGPSPAALHGGQAAKGQFIPTGQMEIKAMLIACLCGDGLFRMVAFSDKETRKITRMIKQMHGGSIRLKEKPVMVVRELVARHGGQAAPNAEEKQPGAGGK